MNLLFGRTVSLRLRLSVAIVLSIVLIIGDKYSSGGAFIRTSLNTLVSPLLYAANLPYEIFKSSAKSFQTREELIAENQDLTIKQLLQCEKLQQLVFLEKENKQLKVSI